MSAALGCFVIWCAASVLLGIGWTADSLIRRRRAARPSPVVADAPDTDALILAALDFDTDMDLQWRIGQVLARHPDGRWGDV